jgi:hypothetical protein
MLPSGDMEFAGHEAGMYTGGAALAKPSIVRLALISNASVLLLSFVAITTENETESVVTCSRLRPLDLDTTVMIGRGFAAGAWWLMNLNPKGTRLLYEKADMHASDVKKRQQGIAARHIHTTKDKVLLYRYTKYCTPK